MVSDQFYTQARCFVEHLDDGQCDSNHYARKQVESHHTNERAHVDGNWNPAIFTQSHEVGDARAAGLNQMPQCGRDFLKAQVYIEQSLQPGFPDVAVDELREAWAQIMKRAKLVQHHKISREELSVREHMSIVLRILQGRKFVEFENLFDSTKGAPVLVVTFIALLELAKETLVEITQAEAFAPIYVRLAYAPRPA